MNDGFRSYQRQDLRWRLTSERFLGRWPLLVWLAACLLCAWLYRRNPQPDSEVFIRGMVDAEAVSVAPVETARIRRIHVSEGQRVAKGALLVEMDTSLVAYGVSSDLLDAIRIETAFGDTHQDVLQAVSQRLDAIAAIEAEIAACRQDWDREQGQLDALRTEQQRRDDLHRQRLIDDLTRMQLLPEIAALEKAVVLYPDRLRMYEKQLGEARTYYRNMIDWLGAGEGEPISDAIRRRLDEGNVKALLARARDEAKLQSQAYELRATHDGTVSEIYCREGDVAAADLPILRLTTHAPRYIRAYLTETQVAGLRIGQPLEVQASYRANGEAVLATVESISPEVTSTAYTLSTTGRTMPMRTQRATLRIRSPHGFVGGEAVFMREPGAGWAGLLENLPGQRRRPRAEGGA